MMMQTREGLALLRAHKPRIMSQFGVTELALFGSFARGEAIDASDLDVLASIEGPATSRQYCGVQFYIEDLVGCDVDLVTSRALRAELCPYIKQEAVYV